MIVALAVLLLAAGQPAAESPDAPTSDAPISTAIAGAPEATIPPEPPPEPAVEAPPATPAPTPEPTPADPVPAPAAPTRSIAFEPRTKIEGESLQVILGQRARFHLGEDARPVLDAVEDGKLADAHLAGVVSEAFEAPPAGQLAAALDASAEKRATVLKVWNGLDHPVDYRAIALAPRGKVLTPVPLVVCAIPPGGSRTQSWPALIVAVGLARFVPASKESLDRKTCD